MELINTTINYLMIWIRFRKEQHYVYVKNFFSLLVIFIVIAVGRYNCDLKCKYHNFVLLLKAVFNIPYTKPDLGLFFYANPTCVRFFPI